MTSNESKNKAEQKRFQLSDIRSLAKMVNQYDLTELEVERKEERIRICRNQTSMLATQHVGQNPAPGQMSSNASVLDASSQTKEHAPDDGSILITSPFVGTFYRAPSPDFPPFVELNQEIKKGQVLCIVEAMKLMNEIECEADCKILEIMVQNAEAVEFGQALFKVFPLA